MIECLQLGNEALSDKRYRLITHTAIMLRTCNTRVFVDHVRHQNIRVNCQLVGQNYHKMRVLVMLELQEAGNCIQVEWEYTPLHIPPLDGPFCKKRMMDPERVIAVFYIISVNSNFLVILYLPR